METTRRRLEQGIDQALGDARADLVIRNARTLNLVTGDLDDGDIAICDETIVGTRDNYRGETEIDARGNLDITRKGSDRARRRWFDEQADCGKAGRHRDHGEGPSGEYDAKNAGSVGDRARRNGRLARNPTQERLDSYTQVSFSDFNQ
jgi:hypothetical protein